MVRQDTARDLELIELIQPLHAFKWECHFEWWRLEKALYELGNDYGGFDLTPDFQRGHVWTTEQQVRFIESCIRGVVPSSGYLIQFNCANWGLDEAETDLPRGLQCVDGLQRYTAVTKFMRGEIKAFGMTFDEFEDTRFRTRRNTVRVAILDFTSRADLLSHYLAFNSGGTVHPIEEIERVQKMRDEALCKKSLPTS
tara:strand:+ start:8018 stop:8608 length:591 start_codon:yes stop_codon:yes gene_type:complete